MCFVFNIVVGLNSKKEYVYVRDLKVEGSLVALLKDAILPNLVQTLEEFKYINVYILSKEEDNFVISGGTSQGINTGDVFNLYLRGKQIKNPQSGMMVELPGKKIGTMTVLMSVGDVPENEVSFCTYEGEDIDLEKLEIGK